MNFIDFPDVMHFIDVIDFKDIIDLINVKDSSPKSILNVKFEKNTITKKQTSDRNATNV